jgi:K+-transporting ATPase ATPase B chain
MFVVEVGSVLTTALVVQAAARATARRRQASSSRSPSWLWFTVLFANFAEAMAEGRGKAQADSAAQGAQDDAREASSRRPEPRTRRRDGVSGALRRGDLVLVEAGEASPPTARCRGHRLGRRERRHRRERAGDPRERRRPQLGDRRHARALRLDRRAHHANPGETFLDRMIGMVEGAKRRRRRTRSPSTSCSPPDAHLPAGDRNAAALLASTRHGRRPAGSVVTLTVLVALLVCLIPTTIGGLLSAIGIAGMDRMIQANVIATSGRAVEAAGDVDVLLLDKTGTITLGNRQATAFLPAPGVTERNSPTPRSSPRSPTRRPKGAASSCSPRSATVCASARSTSSARPFVPFSAQTRMSGVDIDGRQIRKGATDTIAAM